MTGVQVFETAFLVVQKGGKKEEQLNENRCLFPSDMVRSGLPITDHVYLLSISMAWAALALDNAESLVFTFLFPT